MIGPEKIEKYVGICEKVVPGSQAVFEFASMAKALRKVLREYDPIIAEHGINEDTIEIWKTTERIRNAIKPFEVGHTVRREETQAGEATPPA